MDLSIIIVSYNVSDRLKENLKALYASQGDFSFEVFVVDNNSFDGSAEMVEQFAEINRINNLTLIKNGENLGFAKANNQALQMIYERKKEAQSQFILLLNPDMLLKEDTLLNMITWMRNNPEAQVAGPKLLREDGELVKHVRRFPGLIDQALVVLKIPHLFPELIRGYLQNNFNYEKAQIVDSIRGSFFFMRNNWAELIKKIPGKKKELFTLPYLDERYFIWFEEVDFCRQLKALGAKVCYTPVATCLDLVGQSFAQVNKGKAQNYFSRSMLVYFKKWQAGYKRLVLRLLWPLGKLMAKLG